MLPCAPWSSGRTENLAAIPGQTQAAEKLADLGNVEADMVILAQIGRLKYHIFQHYNKS